MMFFGLRRAASKPRWDGSRVLFDIEVAGMQIPCAISRAALGQVVGSAFIATRELVTRFADGQRQIEQVAREMLSERPGTMRGTLSIWSDDIDFDQPPSAPAAMQRSGRMMAAA